MVNGKQYQLSPQASDNTEFDNSRAVSVRDFKILRQRTAEDKSLLETQILANAEAITLRATQSYVDSSVAGLQSQITVQAGQIALKVSSTDYNGNTIASLINQTATTIAISASKINLTGYVTLTNLATEGQTTINGGNITTGTLSADRIYGGTINGTNVNITNLNASNITAGNLSVDRLTVGTVSGWYFGASSISRQNITLGANSISLGGTGTADATINFGTTPCRIYNYNGTDTIGVSHQLRVNGLLYASGGLFVNGESNLGTTLPSSDNSRNLGSNIRRWVDVWAFDGTINTSDKTDKKDIKTLNTSVEFIKALKPVKFKWKNGKRDHMGFLTQDVKQAMDATIGDAGLFIDPSVDGSEGSQGLRYHEFISPMVSTLQNILSRLEALEDARTP